ncbi:MAG: DnaB-like helicase C-terminal domain-containing protein [Fluviibacter sp.]
MADSYRRVVEAARDKGLLVKELADRAAIQCPSHTDKEPSLSLRPIEGSTLLYCHAGCATADVVEALGLTLQDLFDDDLGQEYVYPGGRVVRRTPDKKFFQSGNKGDTSLFHADRLADDGWVAVVEGEKDVLAIESVGGQAVSAPGGAANNPIKFDWSVLAGREVRIIADKDAAGRKRAALLVDFLDGLAASVGIFEAAAGKDAADHVAAGFGLDDFKPDIPGDVLTLSQAFDAWRDWRDSPAAVPVPTPWPSVNRALAGGLHPGRLYVVAARVGGGKSLLGQNIVSNAVLHQHPSLVVSVEMPVVEVVSRIIAAQASVDYSAVTRRDFSESAVAVDEFIQRHRHLPMYIVDNPSVTIEQVASRCRSLKPSGLDVLFVDYAQLLSASDKRVSREQQVAHIARSAKLLAMELGLAVVLAAQLNRSNEAENRQPRVSDLRESGELEQSADVIMLLSQEDAGSEYTVLNIAKNRTGPPKSVSLLRRFDQARLESS